jgi:hypothetical protein
MLPKGSNPVGAGPLRDPRKRRSGQARKTGWSPTARRSGDNLRSSQNNHKELSEFQMGKGPPSTLLYIQTLYSCNFQVIFMLHPCYFQVDFMRCSYYFQVTFMLYSDYFQATYALFSCLLFLSRTPSIVI